MTLEYIVRCHESLSLSLSLWQAREHPHAENVPCSLSRSFKEDQDVPSSFDRASALRFSSLPLAVVVAVCVLLWL